MRRRPRRRFDLGKAMFILPNLFTVSSIFCGIYGVVTAAGAVGDTAARDLYRACIAILFAMVFDSVDGRVARLTRTQSAFGVQLDSLADVISFGVAPALVAWHWGLSDFGTGGLLVCFVYAACGAIRLARFNVMAANHSGPSHFFVGLPIPAGAGVLVAAIIATLRPEAQTFTRAGGWALGLMVALGLLMVSTVPFRTFKATKMSKLAFAIILGVLGATVLLALKTRPAIAIVALMTSYLAFGLGEALVVQARRLLTPAPVPPPTEPPLPVLAVAAEEDEEDDEEDEPHNDEDEELLD